VRTDDGPVALLVDEIGDVERERQDERSPALPEPATAERAGTPVIACTIARPDHLLVVLDLDRVLARAFERPTPSRPSLEDRS